MMARVENKTECQTREADLSPSTNVDVPVLKKEFNASNLCPYCQHALIDWFETLPNVDDDACYDSDHHYPHHSDRSGLQLAVDVHGCRICWLFLSAQRNRYENRRSEYAEYEVVGLTIYCWPGKGDTEWRLRQMSSDAKVIEELSIFFLKMADPAVFAPSRYFGKPTVSEGQIVLSDTEKATNDLSSDYTASLLSAKAWLAECPSSHINCVGLARHRNPTRLLYIKPGYLRLCSGTAIPLSVSYATLSHCWGLMDFFKLTRDNLSAVQKTINIRELSKTFQDAIFIARELGFDYLWIDSLCIIQDDADDWRNEASLMCNVYSHAALNIAAAGAADGSQGCIFERPYPQFWAYPVHLVFQEKVRKFQFADPSTYDRCIRSQPLVRRAWAVQERLLARRTLHFSKTEIFWECKSTIACESFPDGIPRRLFHAEDFKKTRELEWHDVLQYYTAAKLTYGSDKLVALSGIAKTFQQITKDQYLAGMWRSGLESTLCWRVGQIIGPSSWSVGEIIGPSDRPSEERAPSWSWAFVDGQIYIPFARPNAKHYIKVINVSVEPKGEDSFGQVCGGTLELECNAILRGMICGSTKKYTLTEHPVAIGKSMVNLRLYWDCTQYDLLGLHFFIPVDSSSSSSGLNGIVVRPTGNRQGQYRRVGFFEASYALDDESHKILEREMQELNIGGAAEAADFVEIVSDENGRKRYVVEII